MQAKLGLTEDEAHIGRFDKDTCTRLVEATEAELGPPEEHRASGSVTCTDCGKAYRDHPLDLSQVSYDGLPFLHVLCNGERVKL
jgi:hypothetical protein